MNGFNDRKKHQMKKNIDSPTCTLNFVSSVTQGSCEVANKIFFRKKIIINIFKHIKEHH